MNATYAMILTGSGAGAIGVIAIEGSRARELAAALCPIAKDMPKRTARHAALSREGRVLDDGVVLCLDENRFELHVHGGRAVMDGVMEALVELGVARVQGDLAVAWPAESGVGREVMEGLREVMSETAVRLLAGQREGRMTAWAGEMMRRMAAGEALWRLQSEVQWILERAEELRFVLTPARVAIVGPPNAGKSTLANALLGRPVSITSELPGTTRDWVDAVATFAAGAVQVAVTLVDTAGVRVTEDPIEAESIARTHGQAAEADLVLAVVDGSQSAGDLEWLWRLDREVRRVIVVRNKVDAGDAAWDVGVMRREVRVSGKGHVNLEGLMAVALAELGVAKVGEDEVLVWTQRQRAAMREAALALDHVAMAAAMRRLLEGGQ